MAPIDKLSSEVLDLILTRLPKNDDDPAQRFQHDAPPPTPSFLPSYATVCKIWREHIERRTFASINLKSTDLKDFSRIVRGSRRAALSRLQYRVVLPSYSDHACAKFETKKDRDKNNAAFSDAIHGLFRVLRSWKAAVEEASDDSLKEAEAPPRNPRMLELFLGNIFSPMDETHRGKEKYREDRTQSLLGKRHDLFELRYRNSIMQLLSPETLPELPRVTSFGVNTLSTRRIDSSSVAAMATKMPALVNIHWALSDNEKKDPALRQQLRYDFSQRLKEISLQALTCLNLDFTHHAPSNHNFTPITALHASSPSEDHLSNSLYHMSQAPNLTTITLDGPVVISPELFWTLTSNDNRPSWPKLTNYTIQFNACTPSGSWYFVRHPSKTAADDRRDSENENRYAAPVGTDTDSDSNASDDSAIWDSYHPVREGRAHGDIPSIKFRAYPNDEEILPLLEAMARAAACMPSIQVLELKADLNADPDTMFEVVFIAAGKEDMMDENPEDSARPRLYFQTGDWRLSDQVLSLWRNVACWGGQHGGLLVKFFEN